MSTFGLEIDPYLSEIVEGVLANSIYQANLPTGFGKSIGIPRALAQTGRRVFVTVPTIASAYALAGRQSELGGFSVGTAAEGIVNYANDTKIMYVTSGHARRKFVLLFESMKKSKDASIFLREIGNVIIVDEAHLEGEDTDMVLAMWKQLFFLRREQLAAGGRTVPLNFAEWNIPRLLIMSATLETVRMFSGIRGIRVAEQNPAAKRDIRYRKRDYPLGGNEVIEEAVQLALSLAKMPSVQGDILIFLPGRSEIDRASRVFANYPEGETAGIVPLQAHGSLPETEVLAIFSPTGDRRKLIFSSPIAESSLTIPGLGVIIDTMTERRSLTSVTGGLSLELAFISKSSATQRAGRVGRMGKGLVYRMMTKETYERLEPTRPPEIDTSPTAPLVLDLLAAGLDPARTLDFLRDPTRVPGAVGQLELLRLASAQLVLPATSTQVNDLVIREAGGPIVPAAVINSEITPAGRFVRELPLSLENGLVLEQMLAQGFPVYPSIVGACLVDSCGPSYFGNVDGMADFPAGVLTGTRKERAVELKKIYDRFSRDSDVETFLRMWTLLTKTVPYPPDQIRETQEWAVKMGLDPKRLRQLAWQVGRCVRILRRLGRTFPVGNFDPEDLFRALYPILTQVYASNVLTKTTGDGYKLASGQDSVAAALPGLPGSTISSRTVFRFNPFQSFNTLSTELPPRLIGLVLTESRTDSLVTGTILAAIRFPEEVVEEFNPADLTEPTLDPFNIPRMVRVLGTREAAAAWIARQASRGMFRLPMIRDRFVRSAEVATVDLIRMAPDVRNQWPVGLEAEFFRGGPQLVVGKDNGLVLNFVEHFQISTAVGRGRSILDRWRTPVDLIPLILKAAADRQELDRFRIREELDLVARGAAGFAPIWMMALFDLVFGAGVRGRLVLDLSAGYGERMIAAMIRGHGYVGLDPDNRLIGAHQSLHRVVRDNLVDPEDEDAQQIQVVGSEVFDPVDVLGAFDMTVFVPPPFDLEIYVPGEPSQSIVKFPKLNNWLVEYVFKSLISGWMSTAIGGYLVVGISNLPDERGVEVEVVTPVRVFVDEYFRGSRYEGVIGLAETEAGPVQQVMVWQKMAEAQPFNPMRSLAISFSTLAIDVRQKLGVAPGGVI